jgi:hypothetical protein
VAPCAPAGNAKHSANAIVTTKTRAKRFTGKAFLPYELTT